MEKHSPDKSLRSGPVRRFLALTSLSWALPYTVAAQGFGGPGGSLGVEVVQGYAAPARDLPGTILMIINYVLVIVGVLALAYMVYGGFRYITSRGDDTEVEAAKGILVNAVVGIVVIGIAAALVNFVVGAVLFGAV